MVCSGRGPVMSAKRNLLTFVIALVSASGAWQVAAAEPQLVVHLKSGRRFSGVMDGTSSAEHFVLRRGSDAVIVLSPIRWEQIEQVIADDNPVAVAALKEE